jgi:predicted transcriptional regulator
MTRRQAGILALLNREPMTTFTLAQALDERMLDIATDLNKLTAAGVVEHGEDGWALTDKVTA